MSLIYSPLTVTYRIDLTHCHLPRWWQEPCHWGRRKWGSLLVRISSNASKRSSPSVTSSSRTETLTEITEVGSIVGGKGQNSANANVVFTSCNEEICINQSMYTKTAPFGCRGRSRNFKREGSGGISFKGGGGGGGGSNHLVGSNLYHVKG